MASCGLVRWPTHGQGASRELISSCRSAGVVSKQHHGPHHCCGRRRSNAEFESLCSRFVEHASTCTTQPLRSMVSATSMRKRRRGALREAPGSDSVRAPRAAHSSPAKLSIAYVHQASMTRLQSRADAHPDICPASSRRRSRPSTCRERRRPHHRLRDGAVALAVRSQGLLRSLAQPLLRRRSRSPQACRLSGSRSRYLRPRAHRCSSCTAPSTARGAGRRLLHITHPPFSATLAAPTEMLRAPATALAALDAILCSRADRVPRGVALRLRRQQRRACARRRGG